MFVVAFALVPTVVVARMTGSLHGITTVLSNPSVRKALWFSLWQSALSALTCLAISLPITWVLARFDFRGQRLMRALVTVPFLLPTVVVGVAFLALFPDRLDYTPVAIIVAHAYFNVAVIVRIVGARWESISTSFVPAAQTLGASPFRAATTITLAILRRSIVLATGLVALFSFTSFGIVRMLGGPSRSTIETEIYYRAVLLGDLHAAVALAALQVVFLVVIGALFMRGRTNTPVRANKIEVEGRVPATRRQRGAVALIVVLTAGWIIAPWWATVARSIGGWEFLGAPELRHALGISLRTAFVCAAVATMLGASSALSSTYGGRWVRAFSTLSALPLTISAVVVGLGFLVTFDEGVFDLRSSWIITPLAHSLIAMPLVAMVVSQAVSAIPRDLSASAMTLGASRWRAWSTIDGPLLRRPIASACALAAAVSLGEFGASSFLSRRDSTTLPLLISQELSRPGDLRAQHAYVVATLFIAVSLVVIVVVEFTQGRRR